MHKCSWTALSTHSCRPSCPTASVNHNCLGTAFLQSRSCAAQKCLPVTSTKRLLLNLLEYSPVLPVAMPVLHRQTAGRPRTPPTCWPCVRRSRDLNLRIPAKIETRRSGGLGRRPGGLGLHPLAGLVSMLQRGRQGPQARAAGRTSSPAPAPTPAQWSLLWTPGPAGAPRRGAAGVRSRAVSESRAAGRGPPNGPTGAPRLRVCPRPAQVGGGTGLRGGRSLRLESPPSPPPLPPS